MPYIGKKPADIIATAVDTTTGTFSGDIDVDGTTNLDVVDIDGALTQDGGAVFNEAGADVDFRVESDTLTSALFVDGANGNVTMQGATTNIGSAAGSTNFQLNLNGVASKATRIHFREGVTDRWLFGQGAASETSDFELFNAAGVIALKVNRSTNLVTVANGLTLTDGNLVVASGHGIDFGANSNASGMTSELLDDYEEGTWTPSSSDAGGAYYSNGKYVKVGGSVFIQANIGNIGGGIDFGALPFVPSVQSGMALGQIYQVNYPSGAMQLYSHVDTNSKIRFTFSRDTGTPLSATSTDLAHSSCTISISGFYTTTA